MRPTVCSTLFLAVLACTAYSRAASDCPEAECHLCDLRGEILKPDSLQNGEKLRRFEFRYAGAVHDLKPETLVRVWLPMPVSTEHQIVELVSAQLPSPAQSGRDSGSGNCMVSFETEVPASGMVDFALMFDVTRAEVKGLAGRQKSLADAERKQFLTPNRLVPITGKPLELLNGLRLPNSPLELGRTLYDRVDEHMKYDKSRPGYGNGDSVWACDSRFGNCTDFHSLFISLARAKGLPSRFEIGFPIPDERGSGKIGGYHCWAFFHTGEHGWVPTDISEADKHPELKTYFFGNLTENRVTFSQGRDVNLVPRQAGEPLNYFVYPYAETDGKPIEKSHIKTDFSWRDR
jgi:hypothetical protein